MSCLKEAVRQLKKSPYMRSAGKRLATVEIIRNGDGSYSAGLVDVTMKGISEFGVKSETYGKSGWEALLLMANNWKNAGFLD